MSSVAAESQPNSIWFHNVRLDRVPPRYEESDRFESPLFGPHPRGVWISRRSDKHQWCAGFECGIPAYSWDIQDALQEACERAAESHRRAAFRLERLAYFERWEYP